MVQKFVVYRNEMHEVDSFLEGREHWEQVVKYEDYAALETKYDNLLQVVRESIRKIELEVIEDD